MLKLFNAVNAGAGPRIGHPTHNYCFRHFFSWQDVNLFSRRTSLRAHQTGDVSDACFNFTLNESNERGNCTVLAACALQYMHKVAGVRIACIISYQIAKETTSMQCRDQLSHEVTKKVIKAAIKLCMHVICYIWVTLRTCLWNGFQNCPGASKNCLPHLTHLIQLISSLVETEMGPTWNGSEKVELRENTIRVSSSRS